MTGTELSLTTGAAVSTDLMNLVQDARGYAANSRADNTIRAYRAAWAGFEAWCGERGFEAMPASPGTVALYLTDRANQDTKVATLRLALAAIGAAHQAAGTSSTPSIAIWRRCGPASGGPSAPGPSARRRCCLMT